jgi:H+/Cl- antiporter ClcA
MKKMVTRSEPLLMVGYLLRWLSLGSLVGMLAGLGSAVLLLALDWATDTRIAHPWLLWFLPVAGAVGGGRQQPADR